MGFPITRCEKALHATGNQDSEAAMNWLFAHMDDPDIDIPLELTSRPTASANVDADSIAMLTSMGFTETHAQAALKSTDGNMERAVEWLFSHPEEANEVSLEPSVKDEVPGSAEKPALYQLQSIVCHKGRSIHTGYVFNL